ncbi:MAG: hypothetical protein KA149_03350 [Chitinophagales bacterium]|nr:hypothetical protein [Chitinophagales bacterium]
MKIQFCRQLTSKAYGISSPESHSMLTCRYQLFSDADLIGMFEYYGEYAMFSINHQTYKIDTKINLPFFLPPIKRVLTNPSAKQLGVFPGNFGSIFKGYDYSCSEGNFSLKRTEPKQNHAGSFNQCKFSYSNKNIEVKYLYQKVNEVNEDMFYTQPLTGEIETPTDIDLSIIYSGIYLIEPQIGNFSYDRNSSS